MQNLISKKQAKEAGLTQYFTGKPCKRGHFSPRSTASNGCLACHNQRKRERRLENPEKERSTCREYYHKTREARLIHMREYYVRNREKILKFKKNDENFKSKNRERTKARYWENRDIFIAKRAFKNLTKEEIEKIKQKAKKWREKNKPKKANNQRNRRAKNKGSAGSHTYTEIVLMIASQNFLCIYCNKDIRDGYHIDHKIPLSRGGSNDISNLQATCESCNCSKWNRTHEEFLEHLQKIKP